MKRIFGLGKVFGEGISYHLCPDDLEVVGVRKWLSLFWSVIYIGCSFDLESPHTRCPGSDLFHPWLSLEGTWVFLNEWPKSLVYSRLLGTFIGFFVKGDQFY